MLRPPNPVRRGCQPDPHLRVGDASWEGPEIDQWKGWGWRHIQAAHGWSAADDAATREALSLPMQYQQTTTSAVHLGPEYVQNGATCRRRVVVEYEQHPGEPEPRGIITSYPERVTP